MICAPASQAKRDHVQTAALRTFAVLCMAGALTCVGIMMRYSAASKTIDSNDNANSIARRTATNDVFLTRFQLSNSRPDSDGSSTFNSSLGHHQTHHLPLGSAAQTIALNVTVVIRTFLRHECCQRAVASVRALYPSVPILVADDSAEKHEYEGATRVIRLPHSSGVSAGRNALVDAAETPYVFLMDDDFVLTSSGLDKLVEALEAMEADIVAPMLVPSPTQAYVYGMSVVNGTMAVFPNATTFVDDDDVASKQGCLRTNYVLQHYLARREVLARVRWDDDLHVVDHEDFMLRAASAGVRMYSCAEHAVARHEPGTCPKAEGYEERRSNTTGDVITTMRRHGLQRMVMNWIETRLVSGTDGQQTLEETTLNAKWRQLKDSDAVRRAAEDAVLAYNQVTPGWDRIVAISQWNAWECDMGVLGSLIQVRVHCDLDRPLGSFRRFIKLKRPQHFDFVLARPPRLGAETRPFLVVEDTRTVELDRLVWVIVGLYNNMESYRTWLDAAQKLPRSQRFAVLTVDMSSTDGDVAAAFHSSGLNGFVHRIPSQGRFCRSLSLNVGFGVLPENASTVLVMDASVPLTATVLDLTREAVSVGRSAFFPVAWTAGGVGDGRDAEADSFAERPGDARGALAHFGNETAGHWIHFGYGLMGMDRRDFERIGGYRHEKWGCRWGAEDLDMVERAKAAGLAPIRATVPGLRVRAAQPGPSPGQKKNAWRGAEPVVPLWLDRSDDTDLVQELMTVLGGDGIHVTKVLEHFHYGLEAGSGRPRHVFEVYYFVRGQYRATVIRCDLSLQLLSFSVAADW